MDGITLFLVISTIALLFFVCSFISTTIDLRNNLSDLRNDLSTLKEAHRLLLYKVHKNDDDYRKGLKDHRERLDVYEEGVHNALVELGKK